MSDAPCQGPTPYRTGRLLGERSRAAEEGVPIGCLNAVGTLNWRFGRR
jgi:hypothetical protein